SLSESESNISCHVPASSLSGSTRQSILFASRWMPGSSPGMTRFSVSLAPVPNTCGARGRIALSGGGLRPPGPVGGLHFGSWRERAEPMDAAARSQERRALPGFSCVPAAAYSPVHLPLLSIGELASGQPATGGSPMQIMRVLLIALG